MSEANTAGLFVLDKDFKINECLCESKVSWLLKLKVLSNKPFKLSLSVDL